MNWRSMTALAVGVFVVGCGATASEMRLRRVVLYQNGVGYFEREGRVEGGHVSLRLADHEINDVLTTLTVVDQGDEREDAPSPSAVVPEPSGGDQNEVRILTLNLNETRPRDLLIAYAAPTPVWRTTYRLVLPDDEEEQGALLQAWAVVYNASPEDWNNVELSLATSSPFSFRVNLRDRNFANRPDVSHQFRAQSNTGAVFSSTTRGSDPDRDHDRILDVDDQCPEEPETYNGFEDEDGCPDRGRVTIQQSQLVILDKVYFTTHSSEIQAASVPLIDAIAATLLGNPQITRISVDGHASDDEEHAWALSAERAGTIVTALIERGVASERLSVQAFGDTQPTAAGSSASDRERNRRTEFNIVSHEQATSPESRTRGVRAAGVERAGSGTGEVSVDPGGATRYGLARNVSVPAGSSALVTVLNAHVPGGRVLLFRPSAQVPGSRQHPLQAVQLINDGEAELVRGPVALFGGGELLGQGLLENLHAGRTAFVPYGLDSTTDIERSTEIEETPARVLGLRRAVLRVERTRSLRTRYEVTPGSHVPRQLYVHHPLRDGFEPFELPPRSEPTEGAIIVPLPISAGRPSGLTLTEQQPAVHSISLLTQLDVRIEPYLEGSSLDPADVSRLRQLIVNRERVRELSAQQTRLRQNIGDAASRNAEVRASLGALGERPTSAAARQLRRTLMERLTEGVSRVEALGTQLAALRSEQDTALEAIAADVRGFEIELSEEN